MSIKIKKVKIVKEKTLEVSFIKTEKDKSTTKVNEEHNAEVHEDLKKAFANLGVHLGLLSTFISAADIQDIDEVDPEVVKNFKVTSYSIGGDEDDEGVVLTGYKILPDAKTLIMNTPFRRFEEREETGYKLMEDLQEKIKAADSEVLKYLNEGKRAEDPQPEIEFPEAELAGA